MIYHIYKTDCYRASRVLMQQRWEKESIFIHLAKDKDYTKNIELGFFNLFKKIKSSNKEDVFIFHAQSSLPYLISGWIAKKLLAKKSNFVYDIHDLHEWNNNDSMFSKNAARFYVLDALERIAFKITAIKKLTVSCGLSKIMKERYRTSAPVVVRNISSQPRVGVTSAHRLERAIVFFGIKEHAPIGIFERLRDAGIEIHLYGRDMTREWLRELGMDCQNIKTFGEYFPNDLSFLNKYKILILHPDGESLNYKYSLPNKLFQALDHGLGVVVSDFFEEITDLFVNTNFIRSASDENVIHKLTEALESWGLDEYSNLMQKKEKLSNESILNYRETIGLIK